MVMVSIQVDAEVKNELSRLADERVDAVVRELLVRGRRDERFAEMSNAVEMNPPDSSYFAELRDWESEAWD